MTARYSLPNAQPVLPKPPCCLISARICAESVSSGFSIQVSSLAHTAW
ncbi:Uncharacterised protein [Vibrio cholerae]|nr:Uncharacterised protein [Vibrio cholerae]